jgi:BlaI family penicillinase repressor
MSQFTDGELEVMRILWEHGELKPAEIQEHFPHAIKNSALRSYLTILVDKGHVSRRLCGKAFYYKANTRRDSASRTAFRKVVDVFWDGSTGSLIRHLIESEELSPAELAELKRLADGADLGHQERKGR